MTEPPPLGHLVEALSNRADVVSLTQVLTVTLADVLPAGMVDVEYRRTARDRLAGREGTPIGLTVHTPDKTLTLRTDGGGGPQATIAHSVRGVILSRTPVTVTAWIAALADELRSLGAADDAARTALERLLLG
jgi:hypothetical protein